MTKFCIWITGLPGSGKSTIAGEVKRILQKSGLNVLILNLDRIREVVTPDPRYTKEERDILYRSLVYMGKLLYEESDKNIIIDATGNRLSYRNLAREMIPEFAEVYIRCPLEACWKREAERKAQYIEQNLYRKAASHQLKGGLPGVTAPYEENRNPELEIDSLKLSPHDSAMKIVSYVSKRWLGK